jgi:hypothetical protein
MNVKKNQWKAFDLFTTEGLKMPIIRYLNRTGIGRNTGMVGAIPENGFSLRRCTAGKHQQLLL